jgi:hypothetical protein
VQAAPPLAAEVAQPAGGGNTKQDKERQRKERQRQRKMDELGVGGAAGSDIEQMDETARGVGAVEEAMHAAEKHEARSDKLAALVAEARGIVEQARAAEAERARTATEAAAEVAAVVAAKRARLAALALEVQQLQAELGSGTPQPDAEEAMCVVCFDAPKQYAMLPCLHMCAREACAQQLLQVHHRCPVCREPIEGWGGVQLGGWPSCAC